MKETWRRGKIFPTMKEARLAHIVMIFGDRDWERYVSRRLFVTLSGVQESESKSAVKILIRRKELYETTRKDIFA